MLTCGSRTNGISSWAKEAGAGDMLIMDGQEVAQTLMNLQCATSIRKVLDDRRKTERGYQVFLAMHQAVLTTDY